VYYSRNPFRLLNDLPDKPRLGVILMSGGTSVGVARWTWPRASFSTFGRASAAFMRVEPYLPHRHGLTPWHAEMSDFGDLLVIVSFLLFLCGAFIFLRRGFWWYAENRSEHEITEIKFK
jgi:hypothetical protein